MPEALDTTTIRLDGRYAGWEAVMDADPSWGSCQGMQSGLYSGVSAAMLENCRSWNFRAKGGDPAALTAEGIKLVPRGAMLALAAKYQEFYQALPNDSGGS